MILGCQEFEIMSSCVHSPCFYASIREWFLLFNSRPYRHYTAVIMLPYQAHISPDTTYTETDSSSVGQGVHGEEFYVCLFIKEQINKQYITRLKTKLPGQLKKPIFGRHKILQAQRLSTYIVASRLNVHAGFSPNLAFLYKYDNQWCLSSQLVLALQPVNNTTNLQVLMIPRGSSYTCSQTYFCVFNQININISKLRPLLWCLSFNQGFALGVEY